MNSIKQLLLIIVIVVMNSSCTKTPDKWTKGYYDYQMGAIINGEEFHEVYQFTYGQLGLHFGFQTEHWGIGGNMARVIWNGYNRPFYSNPKRTGPCYYFYFTLFYDTEINDASCLDFIGFADDEMIVNFHKQPDSFYDGVPLVEGYLVNRGSDPYQIYQIIEGTINLGRFRNYVNMDQVSFSFIAKDDSGESLVVEDGYCKSYSNLGVYE